MIVNGKKCLELNCRYPILQCTYIVYCSAVIVHHNIQNNVCAVPLYTNKTELKIDSCTAEILIETYSVSKSPKSCKISVIHVKIFQVAIFAYILMPKHCYLEVNKDYFTTDIRNMGICSKRSKAVTRQEINQKVQCREYNNIFHNLCVNFIEEDKTYLHYSDQLWHYYNCKNSHWCSMSSETPNEVPKRSPSLNELCKMLLSIKGKINHLRNRNKQIENNLGK